MICLFDSFLVYWMSSTMVQDFYILNLMAVLDRYNLWGFKNVGVNGHRWVVVDRVPIFCDLGPKLSVLKVFIIY